MIAWYNVSTGVSVTKKSGKIQYGGVQDGSQI